MLVCLASLAHAYQELCERVSTRQSRKRVTKPLEILTTLPVEWVEHSELAVRAEKRKYVNSLCKERQGGGAKLGGREPGHNISEGPLERVSIEKVRESCPTKEGSETLEQEVKTEDVVGVVGMTAVRIYNTIVVGNLRLTEERDAHRRT